MGQASHNILRVVLPIILLTVIVIKVDAADSAPSPIDTVYDQNDPRRCLSASQTSGAPIARFEVLPGVGFDNLRNLDAGQVVTWTFDKCKTTEDGRYLIPDSVFVVPIKSSQLDVFAEMFEHWSSYSSATSRSINADVGVGFSHVSISGKFSSEFESVKKHQVQDKATTTRVQIRHTLYTAKLQPDAPLHPAFKGRLMNIAAQIQNNNTAVAGYLSQLLVRDYGTHVVTSTDAGAALVKEDQVKNSFTSNYENSKSSISASASASFFSVLKFDAGYSQQTSKTFQDEYMGNMTHSTVRTNGGPAIRANFTIQYWEDGLQNELVAVDRSGDPLHFLITPSTLPELPEPTIKDLSELVRSSIDLYYKFNTYAGCTKQDSPNFSFQANVDDGSCKQTLTNFTFGGVYQTCSQSSFGAGNLCTNLAQKNPLTGGNSCPDEYQSVLLHQGYATKSDTRRECDRKCHRCWLFAKCCHDECGDKRYSSIAKYEAFWCAAKGEVSQNSGYLFGGLFTSRTNNPMTGGRSCPVTFYPLRVGTDLDVCVSDDYELGSKYALPFAGFFSCASGNPLTVVSNSRTHSHLLRQGEQKPLRMYMESSGPEKWPHRCPDGYSQHLAALDQSCEINFCIKMGALDDKTLPSIRRPPFVPQPSDNPNTTTTIIVYGVAGRIWIKNETQGTWVRLDNKSDQTLAKWAKQHLKKIGEGDNDGDRAEISAGAAAGIGIAATVLCGLVVVVIVVRIRGRRTRREQREMPINSQKEQYGTVDEVASDSNMTETRLLIQ